MPLSFTYPGDSRHPKVVDPTNTAGEDISLEGGDTTVTPSGGLATVSGPAAAKQSIRREAIATPGSLSRRPEWGIGLQAAVKKQATRTVRDGIETRARRRFDANRRVSRVLSISTFTFETPRGDTGLALEAQVEVGNRDSRLTTVIKPK